MNDNQNYDSVSKKKYFWQRYSPLTIGGIIGFIIYGFYFLLLILSFPVPLPVRLFIPSKIILGFIFSIIPLRGNIIFFLELLIFILIGVFVGWIYKLKVEKNKRFIIVLITAILLFFSYQAFNYQIWQGIFQDTLRKSYYAENDRIKFCETALRDSFRLNVDIFGPGSEGKYTPNIVGGPIGCFMKLAIDENDISYCERIPKRDPQLASNDRDHCYIYVASEKLDENICPLIENEHITNWCYFNLGIKKQSKNICDKVKPLGSLNKDICISKI